eukprot:1157065-Pelagomonas_calceolata.AAC.21
MIACCGATVAVLPALPQAREGGESKGYLIIETRRLSLSAATHGSVCAQGSVFQQQPSGFRNMRPQFCLQQCPVVSEA